MLVVKDLTTNVIVTQLDSIYRFRGFIFGSVRHAVRARLGLAGPTPPKACWRYMSARWRYRSFHPWFAAKV